MFLFVSFYAGNALRAADFPLQIAPSPVTIPAPLGYQETTYGIANWSVPVRTVSTPFKGEPASLSGKVVRGFLDFGPESSNTIAFIWQPDSRKLLLDPNRFSNPTNNLSERFVTISAPFSDSVNYQNFTNVHFSLSSAHGKYDLLTDINIWQYGAKPNFNLEVRSFWQGKVTLQGNDWQAGLVPNLSNEGVSFENGHLLLRPWKKQNEAFNASGSGLDIFPYTPKLFVAGAAYLLDSFSGPQTNEFKPLLQFTEQSVALGNVQITGKYIQRLILPGGTYLVVLDHPAGLVAAPVGSYRQPNVSLEQNGAKAVCHTPWASGKTVLVASNTTFVLTAGGPLTNSVVATRNGPDLVMNYKLIGVGGLVYQLAGQDRTHPPEYAVYKDDKKITSGTFEFG
jgi:hypothetical protein